MLQRYKQAKKKIRELMPDGETVAKESGAFEQQPGDKFKLDPDTLEFCKSQFADWFDREIKDDLELISK